MTDPRQDQPPRLSPPARVLAILLGGGGTLLAILLYYGLSNREPWTTLDAEGLTAARERWQRAAIDDYVIETEVTGRQPGIYRVEVRDGTARSATRNGAPLRQPRTWDTWSVPGMFGTVDRDLDHTERNARGTANAGTPRLLVRVFFHPQYGFPDRYLRIERGGIGGNPEVRWRVRRFERLPDN